MTTDSIEIFEKYLKSLNEALSRGDVMLSKSHSVKTTPSTRPDRKEAHSNTMGRSSAIHRSYLIKNKNFEIYINEDIDLGHCVFLTGKRSELPKSSKNVFMNLMRTDQLNKYFQNEINGNLVIPYWMVPDCIANFTITAKLEDNPTIKQAYIDAVIYMYELMTDKTQYQLIYRNSKEIARIKVPNGKYEIDKLADTYEEFLPKIQSRIKTLKLNPKAALQLKTFLFPNHTKIRKQMQYGVDEYEDALFFHGSDEGQYTIHGSDPEKEGNRQHEYMGTDPTYGVSSAENITEPELQRIHIQNKEQAKSTPSPARSLGAPKAKRVRKKPIGESVFIRDIPF